MDPVVGQQFDSWDRCIDFLLGWAISKNVVLKTEFVKKWGKWLVRCSRSGKPKKKKEGVVEAKRRERKSLKCGCQFLISVKMLQLGDEDGEGEEGGEGGEGAEGEEGEVEGAEGEQCPVVILSVSLGHTGGCDPGLPQARLANRARGQQLTMAMMQQLAVLANINVSTAKWRDYLLKFNLPLRADAASIRNLKFRMKKQIENGVVTALSEDLQAELEPSEVAEMLAEVWKLALDPTVSPLLNFFFFYSVNFITRRR